MKRASLRTTSSWLAAAGLVCASAVASAPAAAETLEQTLVAAYANNPNLLAARAELRSVDEQVPQALSGWRPTVTGTVEVGRTDSYSKTQFGPIASVTDEVTNPRSGSLRLEQPIFRGFRTLSETREAEHRVRAQRALLMNAEQDVLEAAATAYMDVVRDQAVLDLNVNNVQVLERQLQATRDRFAVGEITRTDVAQAEARLSRARADRVQAQGALESSRATYVNVVGMVPGRLEQPPPLAMLPARFDEARQLAGEQNPVVISAKFVEQAARDNVDVVGGELLPTLSLVGEVEKGDDVARRGSVQSSDSVSLQLSVPLYQSGAVTSRLRQAKQVVSQRRMQIVAARRDAVEEATRAWEALQTSRAQVRAFRAAVDANRIALEGVREEAAAGLRTVLDVLDAEQELLDTQVSLVTAQRDEVVAGFQLLTAIGRLTAQDLGLPVEVYDPNRYYERVRLKLWGLGESLPSPEK